MTETKTNITKNTSYLTAAMIMQKIISMAYFTILARELGPENLGRYYFAISFTTIFGIITDLGLTNVITREVAKNQPDAKKLLGNVLSLKLPLSIIAILAVLTALWILKYDAAAVQLIIISLGCVLLDSFSTTFFAVVRGFHNLKYESIVAVFFHIIVMSFGLFFLFSGFSLSYIMSALLMASIFNFLFSIFVITKKIGVPIKPSFDKDLLKKIITIAIPFGLYAIFQRIYTYLDTVLLNHFAGDAYVGYYQIAFRIVFALQFLPLAFVASLYPAMSSFWVSNKEQLKITFEKSIIYLAILALPISAGIFVLADKIVLLFKTGYLEAVLPMQIIVLAIFFIFINFPIGSLLNACDQQKKNTLNMIAIAVLGVAANFILIPLFKATGAAITVLFTNFAMTAMGLFWAKKIIPIDGKKIITALGKIALAAALMGWAVFYLKTRINVFMTVPIGGLIFLFFLFLFKTINKDEVLHVKNSFLKK